MINKDILMMKYLTLFFLIIGGLLADYSMPTAKQIFSNSKVSVLDATVVKIDAKGYAYLKINSTIHGKATTKIIKNVDLSCTGGSPKMFGVKANKRYIFILSGANLFEETSYFELNTKAKVHNFVFHYYSNGTWQRKARITIAELKAFIEQTIKSKKT
jgi:hypothetical protein